MVNMTKVSFSIVHLVCMFAVRLGSNSMSRWRRDWWPTTVEALQTLACLTWPDQRWAAMLLDRLRR